MGMLAGYHQGAEDSFVALTGSLPARAFESVCKQALENARQWIEREANR